MADGGRLGASAAVLELWERAAGMDHSGRALALAEVAGGAPDEPLGRYHARLLQLRAEAFGPIVDATAVCPSCGEVVELALDAPALAATSEVLAPRPLQHDGYVVEWRSPNPADLGAATRAPDVENELLRRCVVSVEGPGGSLVATDALPTSVREALSAEMLTADPLAEVIVDLDCPTCGVGFPADVDVTTFVWAEIDARAKRVLLDVDSLARAYGWTEADVLVLSEARRAAYLRIVRDGTP